MVVPQPAAEPAWRLNPLIEPRLELLGDGVVVFEAVSGQTAVLEPLVAAVLGAVQQQPATGSELAQALSHELGVASSPALREQVNDAAQELAARGWLEAATLAG